MNNQCLCAHPRIILNPDVYELIIKHRHIVYNGEHRYWYGRKSVLLSKSAIDKVYHVPYSWSGTGVNRKRVCCLDESLLDKYYIIDDLTGESFPLYIVVPCGHCDICKHRKQLSFVSRCELESSLYDTMPWFGTLTYDAEHLPLGGLSVYDTQCFLKRFRQRLARDYGGKYNTQLRYVIKGEYGSKTYRPHYHFLFFNLPCYNHEDYERVKDMINKSWSLGFIQSRVVNISDIHDKTFFYTAKYTSKSCDTPNGFNKSFLNSSRGKGKGGIGKPAVDKYLKDYVSRTSDTSPSYVSYGRKRPVTVNRWFVDSVFPSFSRVVPSVFRRSVIESCYYLSRPEYSNFKHIPLFEVIDTCRKHFFVPFFESIDTISKMDLKYSFDECMFNIYNFLESKQIFDADMLDSFLTSCEHCNYKRSTYLFAVFSSIPDVDVALKASQCRSMRLRSESLEQL